MSIRNSVVALFIGLFCFAAHADGIGGGVGSVEGIVQPIGANVPPPPPPCAEGTTFLARTSGLSSIYQGAYIAMICSLVTSGDWAHLDGFYMYVTNTTTTLALNLVQNAYNLTLVGTCTFVASGGYQGDGSSCYQNPSFNPATAGGHFSLNNASAGACDFSNRTSPNSNAWAFGAYDGTNAFGLSLLNGSSNDAWYANSTAAESATASTTQGATSIVRFASSTSGSELYRNGSPTATGSHASSALPNEALTWMDLGGGGNESPDNFGYFFMGDGSVNLNNVYSAAHTFIVTVGGPSGC